MSKAKPAEHSSPGQLNIEQLQDRFKKLERRKIEAETSLTHAEEQLERLRQEARDKFGTDDLATLREKLAEMERENERRRSEYQQSLEKIERDLAAVETKFNAPAE